MAQRVRSWVIGKCWASNALFVLLVFDCSNPSLSASSFFLIKIN